MGKIILRSTIKGSVLLWPGECGEPAAGNGKSGWFREEGAPHSFRYSLPVQRRHRGRVSVFSSRTRTVPQPRQMYLPAPGLSPALYGMSKRLAAGLIKVGRAGGESVEGTTGERDAA